MWQELQMPQWKEGKPACLISDFGCWLRYLCRKHHQNWTLLWEYILFEETSSVNKEVNAKLESVSVILIDCFEILELQNFNVTLFLQRKISFRNYSLKFSYYSDRSYLYCFLSKLYPVHLKFYYIKTIKIIYTFKRIVADSYIFLSIAPFLLFQEKKCA